MPDWSVAIDPKADRDIDGLSKADRKRVLRFLSERIVMLDNPRQLGSPLKGRLSGLWRYRVGGLRIICRIEDHKLVILVVSIGNRREIYR